MLLSSVSNESSTRPTDILKYVRQQLRLLGHEISWEFFLFLLRNIRTSSLWLDVSSKNTQRLQCVYTIQSRFASANLAVCSASHDSNEGLTAGMFKDRWSAVFVFVGKILTNTVSTLTGCDLQSHCDKPQSGFSPACLNFTLQRRGLPLVICTVWKWETKNSHSADKLVVCGFIPVRARTTDPLQLWTLLCTVFVSSLHAFLPPVSWSPISCLSSFIQLVGLSVMQRITDRTAGCHSALLQISYWHLFKDGSPVYFLTIWNWFCSNKVYIQNKTQLHHMEPKFMRKTAAVPERKNLTERHQLSWNSFLSAAAARWDLFRGDVVNLTQSTLTHYTQYFTVFILNSDQFAN